MRSCKTIILVVAFFMLLAWAVYQKYTHNVYFMLKKHWLGTEDHRRPSEAIRFHPEQACKIPNLNPWDKSVLSFIQHPRHFNCGADQPEIFYQEQDDRLRFNKSVLRAWQQKMKSKISCTYALLSRGKNDNDVLASKPKHLRSSVILRSGVTRVICTARKKQIYHNLFLIYPRSSTEMSFGSDQLSIVMIVLESMSFSRMRRHLTETYEFLSNSMNSYFFRGYTKVADNTFPSFMAILTGKRLGTAQSNMPGEFRGYRVSRDQFDDYPFIWKNFSNMGYSISYDEDWPEIGLFHYHRKGFKHKYFDFDTRVFHLGSRRKPLRKSRRRFCYGGKPIVQQQIDLMNQVLRKNSGRRKFFHTMFQVELGHDYENDIERSDHLFKQFFEDVKIKNLANDSVFIILGDHGPRYGNIRKTNVGYLEERLPFLALAFPDWFTRKYSHLASILKRNEYRLSTTFDIHATLAHFLEADFTALNQTKQTRGISLMHEIPLNRTCETAGVPDLYCVCYPDSEVNTTILAIQGPARAVVHHLNQLLQKAESRCYNLVLKKVFSVSKIEKTTPSNVYRIVLQTLPNKAILEGTVQYFTDGNRYEVVNEVSRLNQYGNQSHCISDVTLKKYCLCLSEN